MKLSPFSVSFDGPLDRGTRWRTRIVVAALCGVILFGVSGGIPKLLNAGASVFAAWTNGSSEIGTTGVASVEEATKPDIEVKSGLEATASVRAEAVIVGPKRDMRASERPSGEQPRQRSRAQKSPGIRESVQLTDDAAVELRWRERAAEIERRAPRNNFFR